MTPESLLGSLGASRQEILAALAIGFRWIHQGFEIEYQGA
jgi:hypothetical protein